MRGPSKEKYKIDIPSDQRFSLLAVPPGKYYFDKMWCPGAYQIDWGNDFGPIKVTKNKIAYSGHYKIHIRKPGKKLSLRIRTTVSEKVVSKA